MFASIWNHQPVISVHGYDSAVELVIFFSFLSAVNISPFQKSLLIFPTKQNDKVTTHNQLYLPS